MGNYELHVIIPTMALHLIFLMMIQSLDSRDGEAHFADLTPDNDWT